MRRRLIPIAAAGCCFFLGFESGGYQYVLARAAKEFGMAALGMGFLVTAQFLASMISPALCGGLADRFGRRRVFGGFMGIFSLGCLGAFLSRGAAAFALGVFTIGFGYSMCEGLASVVAAEEGKKSTGGIVNLIQAAFSLGAVSGPWAADFITGVRGLDWRFMFLAAGAGCGLMAALLFLGKKNVRVETDRLKKRRDRDGNRKSGGSFWLLAALMFGYAMIETGGVYFIDTLRGSLSGGSRVSAYMISSIWLSMTVSRLTASRISGGRFPVIAGGFFIAAVSASGLSFCRGEGQMIAVCVLMGLSMGPVWPLLVSCAIDWFPEWAALAASRLVMAGSAGGTVMPLLMGAAADAWGIKSAYWLAAAVGIVSCAAIGVWSFRKGNIKENGF